MRAEIDNAQRPRAFAWVSGISGPEPRLIYDDPRIGCEGMRILARRKIEPGDKRTLSQLVAAFPAPQVNYD